MSELPVTARAISSSQQLQPVQAALPHQASAIAVSSGSVVKGAGGVSVGTVIAEAAMATVACSSSGGPVLAAVPSSAPHMATATFTSAALASSPAAACNPVVSAHSVAVVPAAVSLPSLPLPAMPSSSSPIHRARVVGAGGLHPRQAFTLPHSKKLKSGRHPQQPMHAAAAASAVSPVLAASCLSLHPPAAPVPANAVDARFWKPSR